MEKKNSMIKDAVILAVITFVLGAILAGVYTLTKAPIDKAVKDTNNKACEAVVATGDAVENTIATGEAVTYLSTHTLNYEEVKEGEKAEELLSEYVDIREIHPTKDGGYVYLADALKGYGGKISFALGIDKYGLATGLEITSQSETAGLGAKCVDTDFTEQFDGLYIADVKSELYSKEKPETQTEEVDGTKRELRTSVQAITGATVTSKAVTRAVKAIFYYDNELKQKEASANE